ncbi:hypothetical protein [Lactiplantibacillus plantarum]
MASSDPTMWAAILMTNAELITNQCRVILTTVAHQDSH